MTFTDLLTKLNSTFPDESLKVRVMAVRYYLGIETYDELMRLTRDTPIARNHWGKPFLTRKQVDKIIGPMANQHTT